MPERVAEATEEIARPNRDDQQEKPQIQADPSPRRPRPIRKAPAWLVAVIVLAAAVAAGLAVFWALGLGAVTGRPGLSIAGQLPVRITAAAAVAVIVGGLLVWAFRPAQTLRRTARTWVTTALRRTPRIPLLAAIPAAVLIGARLGAGGGVSAPKGHGASAIRAAVRLGVDPVGRFGHGGAHRRRVRDGRRRGWTPGLRAGRVMYRC